MNLKALLLPLLPLAFLSSDALAQSKKTKTVVETRTSLNIYRPIPRVSTDDSKGHRRVTTFKPTQHYYTRDSVISYRYSAQSSFSGTLDTGTYLGPSGAVFVPNDLPASASMRSFAAVTRRGQPGVGMAAPAAAPAKKSVSAASANRGELALK